MSSIFHLYEIESATPGENGSDFNKQMQTIINLVKKIPGRRFGSLSTSDSVKIDLLKNQISLVHNDKTDSSQMMAMESEKVRNALHEILEGASNSVQPGGTEESNSIILEITLKDIQETSQWVSQEGCWFCNNSQQKHELELVFKFLKGDRVVLDFTLNSLIQDFVCAGVTPEVLDFVSNSFIREFVCSGLLPKSLIKGPEHAI
jgi:hypothetical protein